MKNLTLLPSNNIISALENKNNSTLDTAEIATLTNNLKFAQQINIPGPEPLPTFTGRIQGTKFTNDLNRNGIFDAGEDQPQPGVTIFLDLNNNGQLDGGDLQTQTDSLGRYSFSNLAPATYTVQEIVPPGFERITRVQAVPVVANETTNFDIVNRQNFVQPPPILTGRISGTKFNDLNRNGRLDAGSDQPQSGVTLFLDQNNNGQLDSGELQTQTDSLGGYAFSNLPPATYTVQEIVPAGFTRVTPVQAVTVANETTNFDILNIAQTPPTVTGSISGRKFNDINANGIIDVGEPGIPGFTIYIDLNRNNIFDNRNNIFDSSEPSTLTDATGSYQFNGLQPGTYTLQEVQQPGFVATLVPNPVTIPRQPDFVASQLPNPVTIPLSTTAAVPNFTNINFGNRRETGSISGRKFIDVNNDRTFTPGTDQPQPGVTLFLDINNNAQLDSLELQTQTDSLGGYAFSNLPPATYTVQEIVPAGFTRGTPVQAVTVVANQPTNFDIANVRVPPRTDTGSISGRKFIDVNNDRTFTPGIDEPQRNVILFLDQNNNAQLDRGDLQTQTDSLGGYSFSNLPPATYTVQEIVPPGFSRGTPVQAVTVVANQPTNFDIANVRVPLRTDTGSISGRKFIDFNNDRAFTPGTDQPQSDVILFLDINNNARLDIGELQTQTDNLGGYSFSNLPPATYTVQEIVPPGFSRGTPVQAVTVVANQPTNFDIANVRVPLRTDTGSISGRKFIDFNNDRAFTPGTDQPQSGVTLFLDINNNARLDIGELQTQTDNLGGYSFSNLPPATYTVQEIVPRGFIRVTPVQAVTVVANQPTNFDIANVTVPPPPVTGSISGRKFNDINRNEIIDVGEPGIAGFTIYIDLDNNSTPDINEPSTLTDATGSYQFNDLPPNTYILREVQQPGFIATLVPNPVTIPREPGFVASQIPTPVTIPPVRGFNAENINFGNAQTTPPIGIPGILQFSNPSYSVNEDGTTSLEVMVTRTGGSFGTVDVTVLASDGTANAGTDYNATPITVSFIDGDTTPKPIRIPVINDSLFEPNETINLSLVNPTNGATLGVQTAAALIINRSDTGVALPLGNVGNLQTVARDPLIRESGFDLSANALAIVSAQQGGSGNFIDPLINPGQVARGITYNEGQSIIINVANGFDQKLSFRYASPFAEHQVTIYDGVNGTGNVLASVQLPRTTDSNLTPGAYILESNPSSNLLFQGIGKSVTLGNQPNKLVIGDITFG